VSIAGTAPDGRVHPILPSRQFCAVAVARRQGWSHEHRLLRQALQPAHPRAASRNARPGSSCDPAGTSIAEMTMGPKSALVTSMLSSNVPSAANEDSRPTNPRTSGG
jgi:hypothetical protein